MTRRPTIGAPREASRARRRRRDALTARWPAWALVLASGCRAAGGSGGAGGAATTDHALPASALLDFAQPTRHILDDAEALVAAASCVVGQADALPAADHVVGQRLYDASGRLAHLRPGPRMSGGVGVDVEYDDAGRLARVVEHRFGAAAAVPRTHACAQMSEACYPQSDWVSEPAWLSTTVRRLLYDGPEGPPVAYERVDESSSADVPVVPLAQVSPGPAASWPWRAPQRARTLLRFERDASGRVVASRAISDAGDVDAAALLRAAPSSSLLATWRYVPSPSAPPSIAESIAGGRETTYAYALDAQGRIAAVMQGDGAEAAAAARFEHDAAGRVVAAELPDRWGASALTRHVYAYDAVGRLVEDRASEAGYDTALVAFVYDPRCPASAAAELVPDAAELFFQTRPESLHALLFARGLLLPQRMPALR